MKSALEKLRIAMYEPWSSSWEEKISTVLIISESKLLYWSVLSCSVVRLIMLMAPKSPV